MCNEDFESRIARLEQMVETLAKGPAGSGSSAPKLSDEERVAPLRALLPQCPELRALLAQKPDVFSWDLHNELRHLLGGVDERLSMEQCNIILRHVPKDDYILSILSDWNLGKDSAAAVRALLGKIEKYSDLESMAAACALRVVELQGSAW